MVPVHRRRLGGTLQAGLTLLLAGCSERSRRAGRLALRIDYAAYIIDGRTVQKADLNGRGAAAVGEPWEFEHKRLREGTQELGPQKAKLHLQTICREG